VKLEDKQDIDNIKKKKMIADLEEKIQNEEFDLETI